MWPWPWLPCTYKLFYWSVNLQDLKSCYDLQYEWPNIIGESPADNLYSEHKSPSNLLCYEIKTLWMMSQSNKLTNFPLWIFSMPFRCQYRLTSQYVWSVYYHVLIWISVATLDKLHLTTYTITMHHKCTTLKLHLNSHIMGLRLGQVDLQFIVPHAVFWKFYVFITCLINIFLSSQIQFYVVQQKSWCMWD